MKAVEFNNITKSFGQLTVNDRITFSVEENTVHCLLGENGAGKSTLMKILFGSYKQDEGTIKIRGKEVNFKSPLDAIDEKIGMLYQHFMLIDDFTIWENVVIGNELSSAGKLDYKKIKARLNEIIDNYNLGLDINKKICDISISEEQKVELLKLLYRNSEILIFDEPTAVLSPVEVKEFFKIVEKFKADGKTIIFITHKLNEVKELADKVSVLRRGQLVYETDKDNIDVQKLGNEIIGNIEITESAPKLFTNEKNKKNYIELKDVSLIKDNVTVLDDVSISVKRYEIHGICGVEGNGQQELVDVIMQFEKDFDGVVIMKDEKVSIVPDDRYKRGMIKEFTIGENLILKKKKNGLITKNTVDSASQYIMKKYDVRAPSPETPLGSLSGGNQQKAIIAREIEVQQGTMIFYHPTRGVDINATAFIHSEIINLRNSGKAILLISSDLDELLKLSDRLSVMHKGKFIKTFSETELITDNRNNLLEEIGQLMIGYTHAK
ncbi:MAG: ABC transporter ATP-binding protein [Bacteroidetes bacterium]|nr:ABC transporter ATP-binding protein [Bacteroidota bacterium]